VAGEEETGRGIDKGGRDPGSDDCGVVDVEVGVSFLFLFRDQNDIFFFCLDSRFDWRDKESAPR